MPGDRTAAPKRLQDKGPRRSRPTENPPSRAGYASGSPDAPPSQRRVGHASTPTDTSPGQTRVGRASDFSSRTSDNSLRLLESEIRSLQQQLDDERAARVANDDRLERRVEEIAAQCRRTEIHELRRENQALHSRVEEVTRENQALHARIEQLLAEQSAAEMSASQSRTSQSPADHSPNHESNAASPLASPQAANLIVCTLPRQGHRNRIELANTDPRGPQDDIFAENGHGGFIGKTSSFSVVADMLARMRRRTGCDSFVVRAEPLYSGAETGAETGAENERLGTDASPHGEF